ncbi:hypothetical protein E3P81_00786 [Wallemia ichthyophaga]|nr:hypothetical protein E3P97_00787 [Wallemia ichthyophaga]TIB35021.1 hypothetical protein E3P85_00635 [Wallemia ichthyophaga]TIB49646.1 hypothetical protein E3P82_00784 [Wallemia ichthyophaga]TIB53366.1 hypothetical protein E3P81_00786 [Wallemia ichthyophaga]TIB56094.1 hypothetical protein E3P80_00785 [Wallemia ichthyophaga]
MSSVDLEAQFDAEYFAEPSENKNPHESLEQIRSNIDQLMDDYSHQGISLTGHLIHVSHYLPFVCMLKHQNEKDEQKDEPSDTPKPILTEVDQVGFERRSDTPNQHSFPIGPSGASSELPRRRRMSTVSAHNNFSQPKWTLSHRRGHTAMNAGIRSLGSQFRQTSIGWPGDLRLGNQRGELIESSSLTETDKKALEEEFKVQRETQTDDMSWIPVWIEDKLAHMHYEGYCKTTLWPLFHYLIWQEHFPEQDESDDATYQAYLEVNWAYAKKVAEIWKPGDLVLVHDYHLLLVPKLLRSLISEAYIGMFLHSPFPSSEIFRCLPRRKEILDGMLGSNLVCFQTYSYSRHFLSSCIRVCGYESTSSGVESNSFNTAISHCPIGIDVERVLLDRDAEGVEPKVNALRQLYHGCKIIVGRDKLDVVKGVVQKLQSFRKFLEEFPEWRNKVVLIQVTSPSLHEDAKLESDVADLVSHINNEFGGLGFTPVHHYHQMIERDEYFALLSSADLGLITATRDGMNTTSLEYIMCQSKTYQSPLILSEFTGIGGILNQTVRINPWDIFGTARAINKCLLMSTEDKAKRQTELFRRVSSHTSQTWAFTLIKELLRNLGVGQTARVTPYLDHKLIVDKYKKAKKRLLLFDYDGTLTPIVSRPSAAVPGQKLKEILPRITSDERNIVFTVSGRDGNFLSEHLGHMPNIGLSAEHGCFIKEPNSKEWWNLTDNIDMSWMDDVEDIFKYFTERTIGSQIERKKASITWHYRNCDAEFGSFQCKQCQDLLESNVVSKKPVEVLVGKKNLEVRPLAVNKGEIVKRLLYDHSDSEFVMCAGDDKTDEDMFRSLSDILVLAPGSTSSLKPIMNAPVSVSMGGEKEETLPGVEINMNADDIFTVTVGPASKPSLAGWHLTTPEEVIDALEKLVG